MLMDLVGNYEDTPPSPGAGGGRTTPGACVRGAGRRGMGGRPRPGGVRMRAPEAAVCARHCRSPQECVFASGISRELELLGLHPASHAAMEGGGMVSPTPPGRAHCAAPPRPPPCSHIPPRLSLTRAAPAASPLGAAGGGPRPRRSRSRSSTTNELGTAMEGVVWNLPPVDAADARPQSVPNVGFRSPRCVKRRGAAAARVGAHRAALPQQTGRHVGRGGGWGGWGGRRPRGKIPGHLGRASALHGTARAASAVTERRFLAAARCSAAAARPCGRGLGAASACGVRGGGPRIADGGCGGGCRRAHGHGGAGGGRLQIARAR